MQTANVAMIILAAVMFAAAPTTRPVHSIGDVDSNYQDRVKAAKHTYDEAMAAAEDERLEGLRLLQDRAVKAGDLDQAIAMKTKIEEIKNLKAAAEADSKKEVVSKEIKERRALEAKLAGTRWHEDPSHPNVIWTLNKDGTISISDGRSAEWAAIAPATIFIRTSNGYADEWRFDDDLQTIHDAHGELTIGWSSVRAK